MKLIWFLSPYPRYRHCVRQIFPPSPQNCVISLPHYPPFLIRSVSSPPRVLTTRTGGVPPWWSGRLTPRRKSSRLDYNNKRRLVCKRDRTKLNLLVYFRCRFATFTSRFSMTGRQSRPKNGWTRRERCASGRKAELRWNDWKCPRGQRKHGSTVKCLRWLIPMVSIFPFLRPPPPIWQYSFWKTEK